MKQVLIFYNKDVQGSKVLGREETQIGKVSQEKGDLLPALLST